nr:hypothetical protein [uncultured Dialister sp.]
MTVNQAFDHFMKDYVNLDSDVVEKARLSRDNLLENVAEFDNKEDFFHLYPDRHIQFGSFARKTKCRELDDIDMMVCISADGATYSSERNWNDIRIIPSNTSDIQQQCKDEYGYLDSRKVLNVFKKKLSHVREYSRSDIKYNQQAVVLNLLSKDWSFDIVPCFFTVKELDGRDYYLIPNGDGHWEKTDPRKDRDTVTETNQGNDGRLLELIRLVKIWNRKSSVVTIPSYVLETLIVSFGQKNMPITLDLKQRFSDALAYLQNAIYCRVEDMKDIQGDLNTLSIQQINSFSSQCEADRQLVQEALDWENSGYITTALQKWRKILGNGFPQE